MPITLIEGFENHQSLTTFSRKYLSINGATASPFAAGFVDGRVQGSALKSSSEDWEIRTVPVTAQAGMIVGFALKWNRPTDNINLIQFRHNTTEQKIELRQRQELDSNGIPTGRGYFQATRNNGIEVLWTSNTMLEVDTWYYIEFAAAISASFGHAQLRIDEVVDSSYSGPTTTAGGSDLIDQARIKLDCDNQAGNYVQIDDMYVLTEPVLTLGYLGDVAVEPIYPSGAGSSTDFTASSGDNYSAVDETTADDDSSYIESATTNDEDLYEFSDLSKVNGAIKALSIEVQGKLDSGTGPRSVAAIARISGSTYSGTPTFVLSSATYDHFFKIWEDSPGTGVDWTGSEIDAAEFGIKVIS